MAHYRRAAGALVVYDITNRQSFENIKWWIEQLETIAGTTVCIMLVGNKLDLVTGGIKQREVDFSEAQQLCNQHGNNMKCIETSAFTKVGVEDAYEQLMHDIYIQRQNAPQINPKNPTKFYETADKPSTGYCCSG